MTAYPVEDVAKLYEPYRNTTLSVSTLIDIMTKIQEKYLQDNFTLTTVLIPDQDLTDGIAEITVVEGFVSDVEVPETFKNDPFIAGTVAQILSMHPLNTKKLEQLLLAANAFPDLNVSAVLAQPRANAQAGAVRLILECTPKDVAPYKLSLDNYGSAFSGPFQENISAHFYNVGLSHSDLEIRALQTTSHQEQRHGTVSYTVPVFGASGTKISLTGALSRTEPGDSLDILDVKGRSQSFSAGLSYPLIRQRSQVLAVDTTLDIKNSKTALLDEILYDDRIRTVRIGASYNVSDSLSGVNLFDVHASQGLNILGARETGSSNLSRTFGESGFTKFTFVAGRLQSLPRNFTFYSTLNGQYSLDPLLSSEEYGFGGEDMGRGYDSSEILGDRGLSASIELRYQHDTTLGTTPVSLQPYGFYDVGKIWNIDGGETTSLSAASAGMGLKVNVMDQWAINSALAFPLTKPTDNPPPYTSAEGPRGLISVLKTF